MSERYSVCPACQGTGRFKELDDCFRCTGTGFDGSIEALENGRSSRLKKKMNLKDPRAMELALLALQSHRLKEK